MSLNLKRRRRAKYLRMLTTALDMGWIIDQHGPPAILRRGCECSKALVYGGGNIALDVCGKKYSIPFFSLDVMRTPICCAVNLEVHRAWGMVKFVRKCGGRTYVIAQPKYQGARVWLRKAGFTRYGDMYFAWDDAGSFAKALEVLEAFEDVPLNSLIPALQV